jgi:hypothetical protein
MATSVQKVRKIVALPIPDGIAAEHAPRYEDNELAMDQVRKAWDLTKGDEKKVIKHLINECGFQKSFTAFQKWLKGYSKDPKKLTYYQSKIGLSVPPSLLPLPSSFSIIIPLLSCSFC